MEVEVYDGHLESDDLPEPAIEDQLKFLNIYTSAVASRHKKYKAKFSHVSLFG